MILTPMRYKSYTWPHNPRVYSIDFQRPVAVHKTPFDRYQLQDLGMGQRIMEGEGEFAGEGAYVEFQRLACVFYEGGPGMLVHPLWQVASASRNPGLTMCATPSRFGRSTAFTAGWLPGRWGRPQPEEGAEKVRVSPPIIGW